jgi:hypothetical protein
VKSLVLALAFFLASLALSRPAAAIPFVPAKYSFEAVDMSGSRSGIYEVEGLLEGTTESTLLVLGTSGADVEAREGCLRMAQIAQSRPGRFLFQIVTIDTAGTKLDHCRLRNR